MLKNYYKSHYQFHQQNKDEAFYQKYVLPQYEQDLKKPDKILDLGCGTGEFLNILNKNGYKHLWGVEISKEQYEQALKIVPAKNLFNADAISFLNHTHESFDVILLQDVLEHFPKPQILNLLDLVYKKLNNNGRVIIQVPNADSPIFGASSRYGDFTHELSFNATSITMVLRDSGFEKIEVRPTKFIKKGTITWLVRTFVDLIFRTYLASYFGKDALKIILTANLIAIAEK